MGIKGLIKSIFGKEEVTESVTPARVVHNSGFDILIEDLFEEVSKDSYWFMKIGKLKIFNEKVIPLSDKEKVSFILDCVDNVNDWNKKNPASFQYDDAYKKMDMRKQLVANLLKRKINLESDDYAAIINAFLKKGPDKYFVNILAWPVKHLLNHIGRQYKNEPIPDGLKDAMGLIKNEALANIGVIEIAKTSQLIDAILNQSKKDDAYIQPVFFMGNDGLKDYANNMIANLPDKERGVWYQLIAQAQKANGGKPTNKYLNTSKDLLTELGSDKFKRIIVDWFSFIVTLKEAEVRVQYHANYYTDIIQFLSAPNAETIKGFVWMCSHFHDTQTLQTISALAERCYKKIPGVGQAAPALGNACVYTLFKSKGLEGIGYLTKLKLKVKLTNTQNLIEKYLLEAAETRGVSIDEIQDLAMDDYDLVDGKRVFEIEGYRAEISIEAIGKVNLKWYKPDGSGQKTDPVTVKDNHAAKLKKIKNTQKLVAAALTTQRDRLDLSFKTGRAMTWAHFEKYYFNHGLMGFIARKQIWHFKNGDSKFDAIWFNGSWINDRKETVAPGESYTVSLWHPANSSVETIQNWRNFLLDTRYFKL